MLDVRSDDHELTRAYALEENGGKNGLYRLWFGLVCSAKLIEWLATSIPWKQAIELSNRTGILPNTLGKMRLSNTAVRVRHALATKGSYSYTRPNSHHHLSPSHSSATQHTK